MNVASDRSSTKDIETRTKGIVFLGTPHRGSDIATSGTSHFLGIRCIFNEAKCQPRKPANLCAYGYRSFGRKHTRCCRCSFRFRDTQSSREARARSPAQLKGPFCNRRPIRREDRSDSNSVFLRDTTNHAAWQSGEHAICRCVNHGAKECRWSTRILEPCNTKTKTEDPCLSIIAAFAASTAVSPRTTFLLSLRYVVWRKMFVLQVRRRAGAQQYAD